MKSGGRMYVLTYDAENREELGEVWGRFDRKERERQTAIERLGDREIAREMEKTRDR